jgi:hypothetical protein
MISFFALGAVFSALPLLVSAQEVVEHKAVILSTLFTNRVLMFLSRIERLRGWWEDVSFSTMRCVRSLLERVVGVRAGSDFEREY